MAELTPLHDLESRAGASFTQEPGFQVPAHYGDALAEYRQARDAAALFDQSHRGKVELTGAEAATFLHNLSTNDVAGLAVGGGCEGFLTNAKAKVVAPILVYRLLLHNGREALWLDVGPALNEKVVKHLDHFLISEAV